MIAYSIQGLAFAPTIFERMFLRIPDGRLDERESPDRFTPREVIAHVADWEPIFLSRMQTAVDSPGSTVMVFDEGELAREHRYAEQSPLECLARFRRSRLETVAWLIGVPHEDFRKQVVHPERGPMTVDDLASYVYAHDAYHFEQLSSFLGERTAGTW
ncbi:MAG TPA: DinB family protein [Fimbriimonadaceae bacterium]|nr:DinB family protein [Fimbriimonadaceae bacterium]HRJ96527.1 DinB family protein [Fimbriimonadaceae bacterium]